MICNIERLPRQIFAKIAFMMSLVALMTTGTGSLRAQIDMGGVAGTIKDPAGAVVPGASVTLTNQATGVARKVNSSSSGTYVFEAVPAGTYNLRVEANGFKTYLATGIQVHVQNVVAADVALYVGAVSEVLTVTSQLQLLQAQDASLGRTIGTRSVNDLPLNGRNWLSLTQLSAGTYLPPGGSPNTVPSASGQNFTAIMSKGAEPARSISG
jgi:hypothetical protein